MVEASLCADPFGAWSPLSLGVPSATMSYDDAGGRDQQGENGAPAGSRPDYPVSVLTFP